MLKFLKSMFKDFLKMASLVVGLPVGVASATFCAIMYGVVWGVDASLVHFRKAYGTGKKQAIKNPFSSAIKNFFADGIEQSLGFAFYGEKTILKYATKESGKYVTQEGLPASATKYNNSIKSTKLETDEIVNEEARKNDNIVLQNPKASRLGGKKPSIVRN